MATGKAMALSRVLLLLVAILVCMTTVQVRSDDGAPPTPAPSPSAGGQCTDDYLYKLQRCFPLVVTLTRSTINESAQCCQQYVREMPAAPECLCVAFKDFLPERSYLEPYVKSVLSNCGSPEAAGFACPITLMG